MTSSSWMSTVRTVTSRSAAIARQVETFASWSSVVTTISSPACEGGADRPPDVQGQGRHVVAELDLLGARGTEEVGDRRVALVDHRVAQLARPEGAAGVGVHVAVVAADRVDHALRDLRPAGAVQEGDRAAVLLASQRRELGAQRLDVERRHQCSVPPVNVQLSIRTAGTTTPPRKPRRVRRSRPTATVPASASR